MPHPLRDELAALLARLHKPAAVVPIKRTGRLAGWFKSFVRWWLHSMIVQMFEAALWFARD